MKLTEIFTNEDLAAEEQVKQIEEVVARARVNYGNTEAEITPPEVNTINGIEDIEVLSDNDRVVIAESEVQNIITVSREYCKAFEGAVLDRKIEELLAISPVLNNLGLKVESSYV